MKIMKMLSVLVTTASALTTWSAEAQNLEDFKKIECLRPDVRRQTIWPRTYADNQLYLIVTGFTTIGGLTEEIERGGVPVFREQALENLGYEVKNKLQLANETVFVLAAPGQFFQHNRNLILRTRDFRTGTLENGSFESTSEDYPKKWTTVIALDCEFVR